MATNPLDQYLNDGSAEQKALYSRKADDKTLAEFVGSANPMQYLTGDYSVGAQNQSASNSLVKQYGEYSSLQYQTQKKALAAKGINLDTYLDPSHQLYNPGEGAGANRNATVLSTQLRAKAEQDAIKLALSGGTAPNYKAQLQAKYVAADALAKKAFRNPTYRAEADRIKNLIDGLDINTNISGDVLKQENAAAARVAGNLPNAGAGIGNIAGGGVINNQSVSTGISYDKLARAANSGTPITQVTGDMAPGGNAKNAIQRNENGDYIWGNGTYKTLDLAKTAAAKAGVTSPNIFDTITRDEKGGYVFQGRSYSDLNSAQSAAKRSGVSATYNVQTLPQGAGTVAGGAKTPQRSTYAPGAAGDQQFKNAMDRYNAAQSGQQWVSPTQATSPQDEIAAMDQDANDAMRAELDTIKSQTGKVDLSNSASLVAKLEAALNGEQAPARPDQAKVLEDQRTKLGVGPLEDSLNDVDARLTKLDADFQNVLQDEENRTVSVGAIRRRQSTQGVEYDKLKRDLVAERNSIVNELDQKNSVINTIMAAAGKDFENAQQDYQAQFTRSLQMINLLQNNEDRELSKQEQSRDNARANFTIITNAISAGTIDWDKIDPAQKISYQKLEMQAGLPVGTLEAYVQKPSAAWKMSTILPGVDDNGNQVATVFEQNSQTGEFRTTKLTTDYSPKTTSTAAQTPEQKAEQEF